MNAFQLFARREATTDETWIQYGPSRPLKRDLVLYTDKEMLHEKARIPWHHAQARARKQVTLNCMRYALVFP